MLKGDYLQTHWRLLDAFTTGSEEGKQGAKLRGSEKKAIGSPVRILTDLFFDPQENEIRNHVI